MINFVYLKIPEVNSNTQPLKNIQSTRRAKCKFSVHFQHITSLHIYLLLTSSEPTVSTLQSVLYSCILMQECNLLINKILLLKYWSVLWIFYSYMCLLDCSFVLLPLTSILTVNRLNDLSNGITLCSLWCNRNV